MASQDPTPPRGPPTAFLAGQSRARRRKARGHRSSASGSQPSENTSQAGSSDAGVANTTAHNLEPIDEAGPARKPAEKPEKEPFPQKEDEPVLDRQHEAVPFPERQHEPVLPEDRPVEPEPVPQRQDDIVPVFDPENENARGVFRQAFGDPAPIPRVDGVTPIEPNLTQHNTQHNTQNTYNYTYNHNTYGSAESSSGGGGGGGGDGGGRGRGRGGRRWGFPCSPFCTLPLLVVMLAILVVGIAALYGAVTAWNNTTKVIQHTFATLISFMPFGYLASGPPEPTPITIITSTLQPTPDPTPRLLARAPYSFAKAMEDVDSWMRKLKANPDIQTHLASDDFFFTGHEGYDTIALVGVGGIRDNWIVLAHDISKIEKDMKNFFGPLDKDISHLLKDLRSRPATARCFQEARSSGLWNSFLEWILGTRRESSLDLVHKNLDLAISFYSRARLARQVFPETTYTNIHHRLSELKQATCRLRNSVEASGQGVSRKMDIGKGIAAVVHRSNILCNMFQETERRFKAMNELIKHLENMNRDEGYLEQRVAPLGAMKTRPVTEVRILEEEIAEWVEEIAEPVGKLRRLDLD